MRENMNKDLIDVENIRFGIWWSVSAPGVEDDEGICTRIKTDIIIKPRHEYPNRYMEDPNDSGESSWEYKSNAVAYWKDG